LWHIEFPPGSGIAQNRRPPNNLERFDESILNHVQPTFRQHRVVVWTWYIEVRGFRLNLLDRLYCIVIVRSGKVALLAFDQGAGEPAMHFSLSQVSQGQIRAWEWSPWSFQVFPLCLGNTRDCEVRNAVNILFWSLSGMELQFGIRHHELLQAPRISHRSAQTSSRWMQHAQMTSSSPVMRSDAFVDRIRKFMTCRSSVDHQIYPTYVDSGIIIVTVQAFFTEDTALCLSTWTAREDLTPKCAGVSLASSERL
jgi:hypothetical protein